MIPAGFLLHERKFQSVHEEFLRYINGMVPLLHKEKTLLPLVADDEKQYAMQLTKSYLQFIALDAGTIPSVQLKHSYVDMAQLLVRFQCMLLACGNYSIRALKLTI